MNIGRCKSHMFNETRNQQNELNEFLIFIGNSEHQHCTIHILRSTVVYTLHFLRKTSIFMFVNVSRLLGLQSAYLFEQSICVFEQMLNQ